MADKKLEIIIQAKDEPSAKLKTISQSISDGFGKVSGTMAIAGAAMTGFMGIAVKAAMGAEVAEKQLAHAVLNVTKATKEQLKATSDLADEIERKGVLDGDNIKVGLAQLSTFGLSNDAVRGLGQSMADLAVNQYGVNASADQMTSTANVMAKALKGQFGVLEKSGIRFTELQQKMIMTGTPSKKK
jgi:hypothetical protein